MAKEKDATRARIENIKTELRSVSTCTIRITAELQELLATNVQEELDKENLRVKKAPVVGGQATARRRAGAAKRSVTVDAAEPLPPLAPRERYILATEVANITLKSLTDALKTHPSVISRPSTKPKPSSIEIAQKPVRPRQPISKSSSTTARPLKERSVSQVVNSPKKPATLRRSSSYSSVLTAGPDPGLIATAECARIAFSYLGTTEAIKVAGKDSPELQLENGLLALVGKLVSHGLDNPAIKEMRVLKKRLDRYHNAASERPDSRPTISRTKSVPTQEKESLATLLDFGKVDRSSPALSIITNLQTYALRVIARTKRPQCIEAAWTFLKLSHPSSPANLMLHMAESSKNQAKVARQLESLAQTILLMCPSISSSDDDEHIQTSPDVVLCLQHLAFRVRQRWWALAKHHINKEKELVEPFSKCLVAFSRRSTLTTAKKYRLAQSLYEDLLGETSEAETERRTDPRSDENTNKALSSLAQAAGLHDEALRWLGTSSSTPAGGSAARAAARCARITSVSLEARFKNDIEEDVGHSVTAVREALSGELGGSATELDQLFTEVNALRRVATRILSTNIVDTDKSEVQALEPQCLSVIVASVQFMNRFIGPQLNAAVDEKIVARHEHRLSMASSLAKSTVDSVLVCCKRPLRTEATWLELDTLVLDCLKFLTRLVRPTADDITSGPALQDQIQSHFVKFSNAYWAIYLQLRRMGAEPTVTLAAMLRSTELLRQRPWNEREAGLLPMKLERLGEAFDHLSRGREAREAFEQCIQASLEGGSADTIAPAATKCSVQRIFESMDSLNTLKRVLGMYHRNLIKYSSTKAGAPAFFDNDEFPVSVRGVLLEAQLALYQKTLSRNRQWDSSLDSSIQLMVERLLNLYNPLQFPIRRQRVYLTLLHISHAHPAVIPVASLPSDVLVADNVADTEDAGLAQLGAHLRALSTLKNSLQESEPSVSTIRGCFSDWQSLVSSATSWHDLADKVDNVEDWLQDVQASYDFLTAKGEEYEAPPVLHFLVKILELQGSPDSSDLLTSLCTLGLHFLRLGYSGKAGLAFSKAELIISNKVTSTEAKLVWHLGYAEYVLSIGNMAKCEAVLSDAGTIAKHDEQFMALAKSSTTLSGRVRFNKILADACYVSSLLSTQNGDHKNAARHARQCVVLNRRIWAALEARTNAKQTASENLGTDLDGLSKATFDPLSSMRTDKGAPLAMSITHDALNGADFWALVPSLYRALMQHSAVFINQGLLHEAVYVAEQAEKVATSIRSPSLIIENASCRAEYWSQSGRPEKAQPILDSLDISRCKKHKSMIAYHSSIARLHHSRAQFDETPQFDRELTAYDSMEQLLSELSSPAYIKVFDNWHSTVESLVQDMSAMTLNLAGIGAVNDSKARPSARKPAPASVAKTATRTTRKAPLKCAPTVVSRTKQKLVALPAANKTNVVDQCVPLRALQVDLVHRKAIATLLEGDIMKALSLLGNVEMLRENLDGNVSHAWVRFKATFLQALGSIAGDFNFNALPESTIAFPAVPPKDRQSSEGAATKRPVIAAAARPGRGKKQITEGFADTLRSARQHLTEAHAICASTGSNHVFRQMSAALSQITVLLSAVSGGIMRGSLHPTYAAYMSEIPKCQSLNLVQDSVQVEHETMSREECLRWPKLSSKSMSLGKAPDFQHDYIDILPESWTAVSLALSEDHDELYITRYNKSTSPFVLRLPMARHSSRDLDEEEFNFASGKKEFDDIIELSDLSTRSAKDMTSRESRLEWWEGREYLDTRLQELLLNIENIWLGGFRGIFSQHVRNPTLLARFKKSIDNILDRHLPSRRKKGHQGKTNLDPRVLELFIGLGDPSNDDMDLDEALMDLIYFVVDILQFNGERNAYDEIDFDSMVVETLDALRAYFSASKNASSTSAHTILILDKDLHMFPWESLPCLEKLSISRLPSLVALRERILAARPATVSQNAPPGHHIRAEAGGTSILNPSGDLTHTTKMIKPRLEDMHGTWTHIANCAPSEAEFEGALRDNDLVLYFGHGSGAQFVRSKSVRRLYLQSQVDGEKRPGCATTFLFGCSSVHLSDNGIYEPSGMLASYLTAGAPAVVGMLWDVTDKDCDRFAVKAGELWGLWSEPPEESSKDPPPTAKKSKGKGKVAQLVDEVESTRETGNGRKGKKDRSANDTFQAGSGERYRRRGVGLDEAVKDARKSCVLRYLNGAAAVMYGIPVYLE